LWSNDQKNLILTPAQLASTGGIQPILADSAAIRASAGVGVSWKSPVGPIRLDLAIPIKKESFDKTQLFHVSFGTRF
jgi:outer membrane protein insertion porin family